MCWNELKLVWYVSYLNENEIHFVNSLSRIRYLHKIASFNFGMLVGCCIENWCHFPKAIFTQNPSSGSIKRCHYEVLHLNFDVFWNATWWCQAFWTFQCFWISYLLNSSLPEAFLNLIFQILCYSNPTFEF